MEVCAKGTILSSEKHRYQASIPKPLVNHPKFKFFKGESVKVTFDVENDRLIIQHYTPEELEQLESQKEKN